jgi:hypothetical protein
VVALPVLQDLQVVVVPPVVAVALQDPQVFQEEVDPSSDPRSNPICSDSRTGHQEQALGF